MYKKIKSNIYPAAIPYVTFANNLLGYFIILILLLKAPVKIKMFID